MIAFFRDLIFKDLWLKLFSLALAVLTWLTVSFATVSPLVSRAERTFYNQPVVVMSSAADVRSFKVNPSEVEVVVQGDPRLLQALQIKDVHVLVDLTGIESIEGLRRRIEVYTPPGVTLVRVVPQEVLVIVPTKG